jgi:hypothetical protein
MRRNYENDIRILVASSFVVIFGLLALISTFAFNHDTFFLMDCYIVVTIAMITWVLFRIVVSCMSCNASQKTDGARLRQVIRIIDARSLHFCYQDTHDREMTAKTRKLAALRHYLESLEHCAEDSDNFLRFLGRPLTWTLMGTLFITYASYTVSVVYKALQGMHEHCDTIGNR